jgi:hypothetical protein
MTLLGAHHRRHPLAGHDVHDVGREPAGGPVGKKVAGAAWVASAIIVLYLGLVPARVLDWAASSISTIF